MTFFAEAFAKVTSPVVSMEAIDPDKYNIRVLENNIKDPIYKILKPSILGLVKQLMKTEDALAAELKTDVGFMSENTTDWNELESNYDTAVVENGIIHVVVTDKDNKKALGLARCSTGSDENQDVYMYVNWLVVDSKLRGQGIGQELLQAVNDLAKSRNFAYLELTVLSNNVVAQKTYAKAGFTAAFHTMVKAIK